MQTSKCQHLKFNLRLSLYLASVFLWFSVLFVHAQTGERQNQNQPARQPAASAPPPTPNPRSCRPPIRPTVRPMEHPMGRRLKSRNCRPT